MNMQRVMEHSGQYFERNCATNILSTVLTLVHPDVVHFYVSQYSSQQRLMTLKNDFISNVTHELKIHCTSVSVALEALKNFKG